MLETVYPVVLVPSGGGGSGVLDVCTVQEVGLGCWRLDVCRRRGVHCAEEAAEG